jgi:hypothetical protein
MVLGLKHALEPDHLVTVSAFTSESKDLKVATLLGMNVANNSQVHLSPSGEKSRNNHFKSGLFPSSVMYGKLLAYF